MPYVKGSRPHRAAGTYGNSLDANVANDRVCQLDGIPLGYAVGIGLFSTTHLHCRKCRILAGPEHLEKEVNAGGLCQNCALQPHKRAGGDRRKQDGAQVWPQVGSQSSALPASYRVRS